MNVLVEILGKQFKVEKGDKLRVPYINKDVGEKLTFDNILYSDDGKTKKLGKPYLQDLQIEAKLLEHGTEDKIIVFKFKRRKGYQKKNGHKQKFSLIEISNFKKKAATKKKTSKKNEGKPKETTKKTTAARKTTATRKTTAPKKTTPKKTTKKVEKAGK